MQLAAKLKRNFRLVVFTCAAGTSPGAQNVAAEWSTEGGGRGVGRAHSHTFTHLGAAHFHQCHRVLLTDHLHQPLRSACLPESRA